MCRRRRFKDRTLQEVYDLFRKESVDPERIERIKTRGTTGDAYAKGVSAPNEQCPWPRGSAAYAAWAAGVDNARCAARGEGG